MDIPYLEFNDSIDKLDKSMIYIGDTVVLYSSLDVIPLKSKNIDDQLKEFISSNTTFKVINNFINDGGSTSKTYIIIKSIKTKKTIKSIEYKVHINNIKCIIKRKSQKKPLKELTGIVQTFKVSGEEGMPNIFDNRYFPNYATDNLVETNDRILIDIYSKNIVNNFSFKETEIELRTFQNEAKYGGFKNTINSYQFKNLVDFFSQSGMFYSITDEPNESLDILLEDIPNLRFTISGRDDIFKFCSTNKITQVNTELIYKDKLTYKNDKELFKEAHTDTYYTKHFGKIRKDNDFSKGVFNLYSLRTKLGGKLEIPFSKTTDHLTWELNRDIITPDDSMSDTLNKAEKDLSRYKLLTRNNGTKFLKLFRLKSRRSFMYNDFIRIDLTKTKMSKESVIQKGRFIDIHKRPTYNFIDSDVVNQEEKYECEIEILNIHLVESSRKLETLNTQIGIAMNIIKYMNSIINERVGFVHTNIKDYVLDIYNLHVQGIMKARCETLGKKYYPDRYTDKYISPHVKSFELFNLAEGYNININRDYCVTDKADGLANLLFVVGTKELDISHLDISSTLRNKLEGGLYFIDSNLQVYNSYMELSGPGKKASYILNGEFLNFDKVRRPMNSYGIYDIYLYYSEDVSSRPLLRLEALVDKSSAIKGMNDGSPIYEVSPDVTDGEPVYEIYTHTDSSLWSREDFIRKFLTLDKNENPVLSRHEDDDDPLLRWKNLDIFGKEFLVGDESSSIFSKSNEIWEGKEEKEYKLDGLIYTPIHDPVSYNEKKTNYSLFQWTTWDKNLKWKPAEDNTIDFLIRFRKVEWKSFRDSKIFKNEVRGKTSSKDKYFVVEFYNTGRVGVYNKTKPVRFQPDKEVDLVGLLKIDNNKTFDLEGNEIKDDTIVEVSYDKDLNEYDCFNILRTRYDKTYQYKYLIHKQKNEYKKIQKAIELTKEKFLTNSQRSFRNYVERRHFKVKKSNGVFKILSTIKELEEYFVDYSDVFVHEKYNFGNAVFVANNIWGIIHEPVTEKMITTGEDIPELETISSKYYLPEFKRRIDSMTIDLQKYHNKVIKTNSLLKKVSNLLHSGNSGINIRLLDLACGKGGDIWKWRESRIKRCIGIDINSDNINNSENGAWVRYGKMKDSIKGSPPDMEFLCMDTSQNILERFPSKFKQESSFHIVSVMFALHYFFKDKDTLDGLIKNIDEHLEDGGYFIGACFNGKRIFKTLKTKDNITISKKGSVLLSIDKLYKTSTFTDTKASLGKEISVYMHSIGTTNNEFLVNFDYLDKELKKIGITREEVVDFKDIVISDSELKQLKLTRMSPEEKEISNFNSIFIYKRQITKPSPVLKTSKKRKIIKRKPKSKESGPKKPKPKKKPKEKKPREKKPKEKKPKEKKSKEKVSKDTPPEVVEDSNEVEKSDGKAVPKKKIIKKTKKIKKIKKIKKASEE